MSVSPDRCRELADSYLDHVLLILRVGDGGANLRDFLDPWWSFERGVPFVKVRRGRRAGHLAQHTMDNPCVVAHRERLVRLDWISEGAFVAMSRARRKAAGVDHGPDGTLIVDHSVPLAVIADHLFAKKAWSKPDLQAFLRHHYRRAALTRRENASLGASHAGGSLEAQMPRDWRIGGDPFARYRSRNVSRHLGPLAA